MVPLKINSTRRKTAHRGPIDGKRSTIARCADDLRRPLKYDARYGTVVCPAIKTGNDGRFEVAGLVPGPQYRLRV